MRGPARTRRRGPAYSRGRSGEPRPQPIDLLWTSRAIDTPEANKQLESAWNPLCPCLGCWEQGVPVIVLFVAAFRLLPSASDARWSRSRRGEQAALPASSPAVPDTRARRLCLSLPSHPSSDSGSGPDPQSPSYPWITKALRGSIRPALPSGEAATINASLPAPHYHSISVGLSLDELPPSPLGDWRW